LLEHIIEVTSADLDVHDVAQRVAGLVTAATGSDVCFVHLLDEELKRVVLAGATPPFDELVGTVQLALGEGIAGWVAKNAQPAVVPNKWKDNRYRYIPELRGEDYVSMMSAPMLVRGRVVGVLNVHSKAERTYDDDDLSMLTQVATLMARAIENARLYHRLAEREEMLERFATRTVEAQEMERRRLAGEIHDGISQRLVSLWYHLLAAEDAQADPASLRRELGMAKDLATAALTEARAAISGLRPFVLDDLGLGPGLESLARSVSGLDVEVDVEPVSLPGHAEAALYRIAQEALQNVVRHAEASAVTVQLREDDGLVRLVISDDGRGFDPDATATTGDGHDGGDDPARGYGMVGMRERAELIGATLTVASRPGVGTRVDVAVPAPGPDLADKV
jgi:signal transduction histidine kinase